MATRTGPKSPVSAVLTQLKTARLAVVTVFGELFGFDIIARKTVTAKPKHMFVCGRLKRRATVGGA